MFGLFRKPRRAIEGTGDYRQEIVGESNYQKVLDRIQRVWDRIAGGESEDGHELEITAEIILDDQATGSGLAFCRRHVVWRSLRRLAWRRLGRLSGRLRGLGVPSWIRRVNARGV